MSYITRCWLLLSLLCPAVSFSAIIFDDNFERSSLGSQWTVSDSSRAVINNLTANSPSRSLSLFDDRVTVTSNRFNLSSYASAQLTLWWRRGANAFSNKPENGEDLLIQYSGNGSNWITIERLRGRGRGGQSGNLTFNIPDAALVANFQIRFQLTSGSGWIAAWPVDYWHIDDVKITATDPLNCINDNFGRTDLGSDWKVAAISGGFTPALIDGRLRLTESKTNQSTVASLQRLFPASGNKIRVEFDHYAWSADGGTGGDGIAVVLSDAAITTAAGSFGGSLGYAQRNNGDDGFAGGWLGIGIDEWGNFANSTEGRQGGVGRRPQSITIRGSGSGNVGYRYITTSGFLSPSVDQRSVSSSAPGYRYRIDLDASTSGQALLSIRRDSGGGFIDVVGPINVMAAPGQAAIPEYLILSLTGSTGDDYNNHEINNMQVCAKTIQSAGPHHIELSFDGQALTCAAEQVVVRACANADCSSLYTDPVTLALSPSGWVGGDIHTINNGSGALFLRKNSVGDANVSILSSIPVTQSSHVCNRGGISGNNCVITYADSGFDFDVPNFLANKGAKDIIIKAVKKNDRSQSCSPAFTNKEKILNLWSDYSNPSSGTIAVTVKGNAAATRSTIGNTPAGATSIPLQFNNNGEASIDVNYQDAGLMQLNVSYTGTGEESGLVMQGSDVFVSKPAGFCINAARLVAGSPGTGTSGLCSAADASCSRFVKAGEDFELSLQAVGWENDTDTDFCTGNAATPNFESDMRLGSSLLAPAGGDAGDLSPTNVHYVKTSTGIHRVTTARQSEVGVFNLFAEPGGLYFGESIPASSTNSGVGRFYPDHFSASVIRAGTLAPYCGSGSSAFSYSGQPINWLMTPRLRLTARNRQNQVTKNYTSGGFLKLSNTDVEEDNLIRDGTALDKNSSPIVLSSYFDSGTLSVPDAAAEPGVMQYEFSINDVFTYRKVPSAEVNPFTPDLDIRINAIRDTDGVGLNAGYLVLSPDGNQKIRYGQATLSNAYGPETIDLPVGFKTEYFQGQGYSLNKDDSCTRFSSSDTRISPATMTRVINHSDTLSAGKGAVLLRAPTTVPGSPDTGNVNVEQVVNSWLKGDYDHNGSYENPSSIATFGLFRGHDRIIYWRDISGE